MDLQLLTRYWEFFSAHTFQPQTQLFLFNGGNFALWHSGQVELFGMAKQLGSYQDAFVLETGIIGIEDKTDSVIRFILADGLNTPVGELPYDANSLLVWERQNAISIKQNGVNRHYLFSANKEQKIRQAPLVDIPYVAYSVERKTAKNGWYAVIYRDKKQVKHRFLFDEEGNEVKKDFDQVYFYDDYLILDNGMYSYANKAEFPIYETESSLAIQGVGPWAARIKGQVLVSPSEVLGKNPRHHLLAATKECFVTEVTIESYNPAAKCGYWFGKSPFFTETKELGKLFINYANGKFYVIKLDNFKEQQKAFHVFNVLHKHIGVDDSTQLYIRHLQEMFPSTQ